MSATLISPNGRTAGSAFTTSSQTLICLQDVAGMSFLMLLVIMSFPVPLIVQDLRVYWCWKATTESNKTGSNSEVGVASTGRVDAATAKSLASHPQLDSKPQQQKLR